MEKIDLGKATRRGTRKCPNCGHINGTRGHMCKNPSCNMIFRTAKMNSDCVKLETGTNRQLYSVRINDKSRGFVQLPICDGLLSEVALCFIESCQRLFDDSILKCHEEVHNSNSFCAHIDSAIKCTAVATVLDFKHELVTTLNVEEDIKNQLYALAKNANGLFVQKVSKSTMAVQCSVTASNPLGFLHIIFSSSTSNEPFDSFTCDCIDSQGKDGNFDYAKCIHYYACVCAIAYDTKLATRFDRLIHAEFGLLASPSNNLPLALNLTDGIVISCNKANLDSQNTTRSSAGAIGTSSTCKRSKTRIEAKRKCDNSDHLTFNDWLASVIEQINSCIYPEVTEVRLSFNTHQKFFDLLKDRFDAEITCKLVGTIRQTPPVGTYLTQCYGIDSVRQLGDIFRADKITLTPKKYFVQQPNGVYVEFEPQPPAVAAFIVAFMDAGLKNQLVIEWTPNLYRISEFGELVIRFKVDFVVKT